MTIIHKRCEAAFAAFTAYIYRRKYPALAIMLIMTLALAAQLDRLRIDVRDESFFHEDDPQLVAYNEFRHVFGQDDIFIVALRPATGFTAEFFATLHQLHFELENNLPYLDEITSLVNARVLRAEGDTLNVEDLMPTPPEDAGQVADLMSIIDRYPMYENLLMAPDRSMTSILIKARAILDTSEEDLLEGFEEEPPGDGRPETIYLSNEQNVEINAAIHKILDNYRDRGIEFYCSGTPAFVAAIQKGIEKDLALMVPLSFVVIIFFLAVLFRRFSGVVFPLLTVTFSLISTLGVMALMDIPISNAIQILPIFLLVVGIGDSVHILAIFYRTHQRINDKHRAIIDAVGYAGLPVLMTSLTTAFGLLSFAWADVAIIAQLGLIAPVGVMLALAYTVIMIPALIAIFPIKTVVKAKSQRLPVMDRLFDSIAQMTTQQPLKVSLISALVVTLATVSLFSVRFSHNALTWLPADEPIRVATHLLDRVNGGTVMLEITIDSGQDNGLHDPDLLKRMDKAATQMPGLQVGGLKTAKAWSLVDMVKEINRALHQDRNEAYALPASRQLIAQELLLFESSGSDDLEDVSDSAFRVGRVSALVPFTDAIVYKKYVDRLMADLHQHFPDKQITLTGHMSLFIQMIKNFITSMAKSYLIALVVITFLMILMIGRVRIGLMSMIANVVPIICIFGIMGILEIPVDMATILIGSLVLGCGG
jgi:predicted RND superfamily exporter protein